MYHSTNVYLTPQALEAASVWPTDDRVVVKFGDDESLSLFGGWFTSPVDPSLISATLRRLADDVDRLARERSEQARRVDDYVEAQSDARAAREDAA